MNTLGSHFDRHYQMCLVEFQLRQAAAETTMYNYQDTCGWSCNVLIAFQQTFQILTGWFLSTGDNTGVFLAYKQNEISLENLCHHAELVQCKGGGGGHAII